MCAGNLSIVSCRFLTAGLNGASWGNTLATVLVRALLEAISCLALSSNPYVNESLTSGLFPWAVDRNGGTSFGNLLSNIFLYFIYSSLFLSNGSGICFGCLKIYV